MQSPCTIFIVKTNDKMENKCKRVAYARVVLPTGEVLRREVVEFDERGKVVVHFPLKEELPFVEWCNKTFVVSD